MESADIAPAEEQSGREFPDGHGQSLEKIYGAIVDRSPIGISVRDRNGNLVLCNRSWVGIWEMTSQAVEQALSTRRDSLQMDSRDSYLGSDMERVRSIYENGGELELDPIHSTRLGKWIRQRFYGIPDEQGVNRFVVILTEDITELVKAEEIERNLKRSLLKYRKLVENLPVAAYTTDRHGNCISANRAMVEMFEEGSLQDLFSVPVSERYLNAGDREVFLEKMTSSGMVQGYEVQLVTGKGRPFWASISATATTGDDGDVAVIDGVIRDITSAKALEREMLKNQKLESIGILAGGIAHDFNNILSAILGNISLARLYAGGEGKVTEKLEEAERASIRASELTRQLLTFSRGGKPVRKKCDLRKVIRETASFAISGSRAVLDIDLPGDLWAVEADESQIGQVMNNLVLNAVQSSPEGCRIRISGENLILEDGNPFLLKPGFYLKLLVRDDGPGVPDDIRDKIFDPCFSTRQSGSGLGLATVHSILSNHAGSITLDSRARSGACFVIHLPAIGKRLEAGHGGVIPGSPAMGRILVMDDEDSVRRVVSEILLHHGYQVDTAREGSVAVEMYRTAFLEGRSYDAVITDVTVPGGMGGVETAGRILGLDPDARLIVASGYSNNAVMANYAEHGFQDCLEKPFRIGGLLKTLQRVLGN